MTVTPAERYAAIVKAVARKRGVTYSDDAKGFGASASSSSSCRAGASTRWLRPVRAKGSIHGATAS